MTAVGRNGQQCSTSPSKDRSGSGMPLKKRRNNHTEKSRRLKPPAQNRFKDIISTLRNKNRTVFALVLYPESTPIMESYRAMLDTMESGIETQLVVANMVLPEEVCTNAFFRNRRRMQLRYLQEIKERFNLPVLQFPLLQEEIKGLHRMNMAAKNL